MSEVSAMPFAKMTWRHSLSVKILFAYVAGVVLSIALMGLATIALVRSQGDLLSGTDVVGLTQDMASKIRFNDQGVPTGFDTAESGLNWAFESLKHETAYRVLDASGALVFDSPAGQAFWPLGGAAAQLTDGRFGFAREGVAMYAATAPFTRDGRTWYLQCAVSKRFMHAMYNAFALPFTQAGILMFSLLLLFVFCGCASLTLRLALKPLLQMSDSAAAISPRSLDARLATHAAPSEIVPLVDSFNRVLERLQQGYRVQQEFLATAAHELKTPLALIRAQIELGGSADNRGDLLQDVAHMSRQVQQLLHLAEVSETHNYQATTVDVHAAAKDAADYLLRMADAASVRLELPARTSGIRWTADRGAMFTLLKNLLENAIQHSPAGTAVRIDIEPNALSVRDWGVGVPLEQVHLIFGRFWRGAHRRDIGAGLGLAICHEISLAHGWTLSVENANPGLVAVVKVS